MLEDRIKLGGIRFDISQFTDNIHSIRLGNKYILALFQAEIDFIQFGLPLTFQNFLVMAVAILAKFFAKPILLNPILLSIFFHDFATDIFWFTKRRELCYVFCIHKKIVMSLYDLLCHSTALCTNNNKLRNFIGLTKYFFTELFSVCLFVIVDTYEDCTIWSEQIFCQLQSRINHIQPIGMETPVCFSILF